MNNSHQLQKNKPINKPNNHKKPYRPTFNNDNPHNKLTLNKYHQIQQPGQIREKSQAFKLHKRKRDLERMLRHCQEKGIAVDSKKKQQLQNIQNQLNDRRKNYQKGKRKEFFLEQKYKDIKRIQLRKVYKKLGQIKNDPAKDQQTRKTQLSEWEVKLRYIKNFPKNLKYISLFPSAKPLEEKTRQFQKKIMADIEENHKKRVSKMNFYKSENQVTKKPSKDNQKESQKSSILPTTVAKAGKKTKKVVDDFFIQEQDEENSNEQNEQQMDSQQEQEDGSDIEIEDEEQSLDEDQDEEDDE